MSRRYTLEDRIANAIENGIYSAINDFLIANKDEIMKAIENGVYRANASSGSKG